MTFAELLDKSPALAARVFRTEVSDRSSTVELSIIDIADKWKELGFVDCKFHPSFTPNHTAATTIVPRPMLIALSVVVALEAEVKATKCSWHDILEFGKTLA